MSRLVVLSALLVACPKPGATPAADSPQAIRGPTTERPLPEEGLIMQEVDLNRDGRPDIFNKFRQLTGAPRLLLEKQLDLNFDGRVDLVSSFDETGTLVSEQMDSDFDGRIDWTDHYQGGKRVISEMDTDFDGKANIFFYYESDERGIPRIQRKERDTNGDGKVDYWERFDAEGKVIKIGRDTDGDGKMDERDE